MRIKMKEMSPYYLKTKSNPIFISINVVIGFFFCREEKKMLEKYMIFDSDWQSNEKL